MNNTFEDGPDRDAIAVQSAEFWVREVRKGIRAYKKVPSVKNRKHLLHCQQKMLHARKIIRQEGLVN